MRWYQIWSFLFTISFLSCNPVKSNDAFLLTLINGLTPTTTTNSFLIGSSSKINVTSASVVLTYGTSQTFEISLGVVPTSNVTINFTFDSSKLSIDGNTSPLNNHLTFIPGNYNSPLSISLSSLSTLPTTSTFTISVSSADLNFNGVSGSISVRHRVQFYTGNSFVFKQNETIPTLSPYVGFPYTSCSVNPSLPAGLSLNPTTCVISGTPTTTQANSNYTISATNGTISDSETIGIRVETNVYKVFVTASTYNGNLQGAAADGPAGADVKCNADANKPSTGTYKAMVVDGTNRRACSSPNCSGGGAGENFFWVFQENSIYVRANDSASLFTPSTAGIIPAPSTILNHNFDSGTTKYFWTGFAMTAYWQEATDEPTNSCVDWTDGSVTAVTTDGGRVGASDSRTYSAFRSGSGRSCSDTYHLLCVEQ